MKKEQITIIIIALIIGYLLYLIMVPFWTPVFWAVVLSILFYPFYGWLKIRLRIRDSLVSLVACASIAIFLTLPVILIVAALVDETLSVYDWLEGYLKDSGQRFHNSPYFIVQFLERTMGKYIDISTLDIKEIMLKSAKEASTLIAQNISGVITNFADFALNLILTFFVMFYLFKDGDKIVDSVKGLLPLSKEDKDAVFKKTRKVVNATLYGGVLVSVAQGSLGGLSFWALGIPSPIFWGAIMTFLAFLPMVGPPIVWIPAVIYLFVKVSYIKAIILVVIGTFVIGLVDNLLRPMIVSGKTDIHPLLLILSILGALKAMGFIGIIAGPIILSLSLTVIEIYKAGYLLKRAADNAKD